MSTFSTSSVRDYISNLELPETAPVPQAGPAVSFERQRQSLAIGTQLTEFTEAVVPEARQAIADSLLLAQLAAQKATESADVLEWYREYVAVLQNIGWQAQSLEFKAHEIKNKDADLHEAILPVLTVLLGAHVAAVSMVLAVLKGLNEMDKDTPWITVFDRASQHSRGAKFQVSYVDANDQGDPEIAALCLGIEAERRVTQVLFFKFSSQEAQLKVASSKLALTRARLNSVKEAVADRVQPFIREYVANVEI